MADLVVLVDFSILFLTSHFNTKSEEAPKWQELRLTNSKVLQYLTNLRDIKGMRCHWVKINYHVYQETRV